MAKKSENKHEETKLEADQVVSPIDSRDEEMKRFEDKVTNLEDQLKRAVADYRNLERRIQEDSVAVAQYLRSQLIVKLLPVLDNLDQAVKGASEVDQQSGWFKGVSMSVKQFKQVLIDEGLNEIPASDTFDPRLHEAVDTADGEEGKIVKVLSSGYTLGEKVIRPTKVVVGKKGETD